MSLRHAPPRASVDWGWTTHSTYYFNTAMGLWVYVSQNYFFKFTSVSALESLKDPSDDFLDISPELEDYKKKFFFSNSRITQVCDI